MRHPLNWILRAAMPEAERVALLGDLEEEYRRAVHPARGPLRAQIWYARELAAACAFGLRDRIMRSGRERAGVAHQNPVRPTFRLFGGDVRHALRRWRRRPGFAATAILTLALGIGTTTALFSIVDAVLLAPPPWPDADRLVAIHAVFPERRQNPASATTWNRGMLSYPAWDALRRDPAFQDIGAWRRWRRHDTTFGESRTEIVETMGVSSSFLPLLGIGLSHGRYFTETEDNTNSDSVILTYEAWQRRYSGREDIIGRPAILGSASTGDHLPSIVVGVLAPGFAFDGDPVPEILFPVGIGADVFRMNRGASLRLAGRLAPGVSLEAAAGAANAIVRTVEQREPALSRLVPLLDDQWRGTARPLWVLFGGAALLLLVACSNVAGLLLGEGRARRHEIAVRSALGGSRGRVVRQLVVEHALLAIGSAVCGLVLAHWLMQALVAIAPAGLPRLESVEIDVRVAAFALGLGALTVLVFGIGPALSLARTPAAEVLAQGGRDQGIRRHSAQRAVVAGQVALALVLLAGASLLGDTLFRLASQPLGFNPAGLAIVAFRQTWLPGVPTTPITVEEYQRLTPDQHADRNRHFDHLWTAGWWLHMSGAIDRVAVLPGVQTVGGGYSEPFTVPFTGMERRLTSNIHPEGRPAAEAEPIRGQVVTDRYFEAMGIRVVRGHTFQEYDRRTGLRRMGGSEAPRPVVISRELDRRFFDGDGVGRRMLTISPPVRLDVIGVVEDVRWRKRAETDAATYYMLGEAYQHINTLVIRAAGDAGAVLPSVREALRAYDPNIVVTATATMDSLLAQSIAEERFRATLSGIFGAAALVLSAVGLYSLCVRRVADRRREIAVRVALGARPGDVRGLVLGDAWRTVGVGLVVGVPAAIAAAQVTQSILAGVTPATPRLFLIATVVLALAALVAIIHPMRRAAAIDPMAVLKE